MLEFERKLMKIWVINNYGRKEYVNILFNIFVMLMYE